MPCSEQPRNLDRALDCISDALRLLLLRSSGCEPVSASAAERQQRCDQRQGVVIASVSSGAVFISYRQMLCHRSVSTVNFEVATAL